MNMPSENDLNECPTSALLGLRSRIDDTLDARRDQARADLAALDAALGDAKPTRAAKVTP